MKPAALCLLGPTASGKSRLAMALAERFPLEIVSVDSAQVYRGMDVGTAKPSLEERHRVPHHLIDIVDPTERYSAARFAEDARSLVAQVQARGRLPLLVGGTMLYFHALRHGLDALPSADPGVRSALDAQAARIGWPAMHETLARLDPASAARIEPNDPQRIQRALEVIRITGRPLSEQLGSAAQAPYMGSAAQAPLEALWIALAPAERSLLHEHIARRFDRILADGLVEELKALRQRYDLDPKMPSMRSVGYRQAWEFLEGRLDARALREKGIAATRQLAKRQLTWLRKMGADETLDPYHDRTLERLSALLGPLMTG